MSKNRWLRTGIPVLTLILVMSGTQMRLPHKNHDYLPLDGDTLSCLIIPGDVYRKHQYPVGYHYQILQEFAKDRNCILRLSALPDSASAWEALMNRQIRFMVINAARDSVPEEIEDRIIASPPLNSRDHVWVFLKEDFEIMQVMSAWFNSFKYTAGYANITSRFYTKKKGRNTSLAGGELSPYDETIKKYSKSIGWDWRLLASLVYQESNFRMNVTSSKGAVGLMQVKHSSVKNFGITPEALYDPDENIRAGTLMLKELTFQLRDSLLQESELLKFILAAYNAGHEQVKNCRSFASLQGKNPDVWAEVAEVIPLMRQQEYAHLTTRRFKGDETIRFVDEVLERYERYCEFLE